MRHQLQNQLHLKNGHELYEAPIAKPITFGKMAKMVSLLWEME